MMNTPKTGLMTQDTTLALLNARQNSGTEVAKTLQDARQIEKISRAAEDFEAVFVSEMMKPMFEGISTEAPFGGGKGEEIFRGMLLGEYGKSMAKTSSFGIADAVKREMLKLQEQQQEQ